MGVLVSRATWEITSDLWEGNKIYRKEDGRSWLDPHHIPEKAKSREASAGSLCAHTCTHIHTHMHTYMHTYTHATHGHAPQPLLRMTPT